jgi:hypothetical protein
MHDHTHEREQVAKAIWLRYFNRVLYTGGHITEREYRRMALLIDSNKSYPQNSGMTAKA